MLNTQRFLRYSGWFFLVLTFISYIGLGPTPSDSLFGQAFYLDAGENIAHLLLGVAALLVLRFTKTDRWLRIWSGIFGVLLLIAAVVGFLNQSAVAPNVGLANFELTDNLIHLVGALWGFWVAFMPEGPVFVREDKATAISAEAK
jgi:hypothetical protein